ncbi:MAG: type III pantothenate kinase [Ardenticatenales bacterium]|nr:type III pantothenate kinase [Ardenticatenales bacterium]
MLLTVDVGNTHVKFAVYEEQALRGNWRATTDRERTPDEWGIHLERFLDQGGLGLGDLSGCIIASVVPQLTDSLRQMAEKYPRLKPLIVTHESNLGIGIDYPHPYEIGADRLVNSVAAFAAYGAPVFVVDFGTGTTFDIVNAEGAYTGGIIAPGLEASLAALSQRAARLFNVALEFPPSVIGKSTAQAMQSGLLWGYVSLIEGLGARVQEALGQPCPVIATGGLADRIAPHTTLFTVVDHDLTVKGLRLIWERNQR